MRAERARGARQRLRGARRAIVADGTNDGRRVCRARGTVVPLRARPVARRLKIVQRRAVVAGGALERFARPGWAEKPGAAVEGRVVARARGTEIASRAWARAGRVRIVLVDGQIFTIKAQLARLARARSRARRLVEPRSNGADKGNRTGTAHDSPPRHQEPTM